MKNLLGIVGVAFLFFGLTIAPARAELVHQDVSAFGDQKATYDSSSGLSWLKLTETFGANLTEIETQFGVGGKYEGWRLPSRFEMDAMFAVIFQGAGDSSAFWGNTTYTSAHNGYAETWGTWFGKQSGVGDNFASFGIYKGLRGDAGIYKLMGVASYENTAKIVYEYDGNYYGGGFADANYGVFLVRESAMPEPPSLTTDVPAPGVLWTAALMFGFVMMRRK